MPSYFGTPNRDTIQGSSSNDFIYGYDGFDTAYGNGGNDFLDVGSYFVNSTQVQDTSGNIASGGEGNDSVYGGDGADRLSGDAGDDYVDGRGGNDKLYGGTGNDQLRGGNGRDTAYGNEGNDNIDLGTYFVGSSFMKDTSGNLGFGGDGKDSLFGGDGMDSLNGDAGDDYLDGYAGNDSLSGGDGNDFIVGGVGNDTLSGGAGMDTLQGMSGDDIYLVGDRADRIWDNSGTNDKAIIQVDFYKKQPGTGVDVWEYAPGVQELPYWIDGLTSQFISTSVSMGTPGQKILYYNFPVSKPSDTSSSDGVNWAALNASEAQAIRDHLRHLETLIDVKFVETNDPQAASLLRFAHNSAPDPQTAAYAYLPSNDGSSDIFFDLDNRAYNFGGSNVIIHEVMHALGLKHSFEFFPGVDTVLPREEENTTWTSMSYSGNTFHTTPRLFDVAALQYIFGPSLTSRSGNDVYLLNESTTNMLWDGGGKDTIDGSRLGVAMNISLNQGYWGYIGSTRPTLISAAGSVTINIGTTIENLIGGSSHDVLTGNKVNNVLNGKGGNDTLDGGAGKDQLYGGSGSDTYVVDHVSDVVSEIKSNANPQDAGGVDTVQSSVSWTLGDFVENLVLTGSGSIAGTGNALSNSLTGNSSANVLDGGAGIDKMFGGAGDDTYLVDHSSDITSEFVGSTDAGGFDTVISSVTRTLNNNFEQLVLVGSANINGTGNAQDNVIVGNSGANTLSGGAGNDVLNGKAGADVLIGGGGKDRFEFDFLSNKADEVRDFRSGEDSVDVSAIDADALQEGHQVFKFIGLSGFQNGQYGLLRYLVNTTTSGSNVSLLGDVNGDAVEDFRVNLVGLSEIKLADLVLA